LVPKRKRTKRQAIMQQKQEAGMTTRISMITLGVKDLEESVKFYKDGLGFPKRNRRLKSHSLPSMAVG